VLTAYRVIFYQTIGCVFADAQSAGNLRHGKNVGVFLKHNDLLLQNSGERRRWKRKQRTIWNYIGIDSLKTPVIGQQKKQAPFCGTCITFYDDILSKKD
jgi:hypothetical protein